MTRPQREFLGASSPLVAAAVCAAAGAWAAAALCMGAFIVGLGAVAWRWRA